MSKTEYLQWYDPTADRAIFGVEGRAKQPSFPNGGSLKPGSETSLTQAEIDGRIHLAKIGLANGGNRAQYRAEVDTLRAARRQTQGGNK